MESINRYIPVEKNYISFKEIKEMANGGKTDDIFSKIFRISLRHFYLKDIYNVTLKSPRTTWGIRMSQIRKGKEFMEDLQE